MLGLLPLLSLILLGLSVHARARKEQPLRESFLIGFLIWGSFITAVMEVLSIFRCLTFSWVLLSWCFLLIAAVMVIWYRREYLYHAIRIPQTLSWIEKVFLLVILLIVTCLAVIAFFSPPNTCDAMTYHMSRVVHWIQNHTVAYYPTRILRQLFSPPWVEYVIFQFQILSKGDQWAHAAQYLSMIASLVGVSLVAQELGAKRWGQIISVLVAVTIPMGILQATSTQTDYGAALWLCVFFYFFLRWRKCFTWGYTVCMAVALGLALLAKGTGLVYAAPVLIWILGIILRRIGFKSLTMLAMILGVVVIFNCGYSYRNAKLFNGHIFMSVRGTGMYTGIDSLTNDHFGWQELAVNTLRNAGSELPTPWVGVNKTIEGTLYRMADSLKVDMNDPSSSFQGKNYAFPVISMHEDIATNTLHAILFAGAILLFVIFPSFRNWEMLFYLLALLGMMIVFNVTLKWQSWGTRYHLSFLVMAAPFIGAVFERVRVKSVIALVMAVVVACSLPYLFHNPLKSFVTFNNIVDHKERVEEYYPPSIVAQYKDVQDGLKKIGCHDIGLLFNEFYQEYPIWALFNPANDEGLRLEHIGVNEMISPVDYPLGKFEPCALISSGSLPNQFYRWGENGYVKVLSQGKGDNETDIFVKVSGATNR